MKKTAKMIWIIVGVVFVFAIIISRCAKNNTSIEEKPQQNELVQKDWDKMTYEEKSDFLNNSLEKRDFALANELHHSMREAIKKELANPKTLRFTLDPFIYNGMANVVEADSGWIYVPFRCTAKNDFGVEKELAGSVMYMYNPEKKSLEVKRWDMNQNN